MNVRNRLTGVLVAVVLATTGFAASPNNVLAFPCLVDNGTINAKDSGAAGYPGIDAPTPDKFWGPDDAWHDQYLYEWCETAHDWMKDRYIRWSAQAVTWIRDKWNNGHNFMIFEQIIANELQYNNRNNTDSSLPYTEYYVADIFEQLFQHYEEAGWWMHQRSVDIVAGTNYYAYAQWDQEKSPMDSGFREFSSQAEEVDANWFDIDGVDSVGKMLGKHWNQ